LDVELGEIVPSAIQEDPDGAGAADEEGLPPPVVVLYLSVSTTSHSNEEVIQEGRGGEEHTSAQS
jgi:hypothetical protein